MAHKSGAAQLKGAIDAGKTRDKVAFPDHAAAPLGTDDEAAGEIPQGSLSEVANDAPASAELEKAAGEEDHRAPVSALPSAQSWVVIFGGLVALLVILATASWMYDGRV